MHQGPPSKKKGIPMHKVPATIRSRMGWMYAALRR